jgi:hypothetical protein
MLRTILSTAAMLSLGIVVGFDIQGGQSVDSGALQRISGRGCSLPNYFNDCMGACQACVNHVSCTAAPAGQGIQSNGGMPSCNGQYSGCGTFAGVKACSA